MNTKLRQCIAVLVPAVLWLCPVHAEKTMVYDEARGIIFVDTDSAGKPRPPAGEPVARTVVTETETTTVTSRRAQAKEDLHLNRQKDPADLYFKSALEYFRNADYENALRNFRFADSLDHKPAYPLWIGKVYRQMGKTDQMLAVMGEILKSAPRSDVADDALFEIAFHFQVVDNYDSATQCYARLAEQYPFGTSYSNGEPFLEVSREQRKAMRQEMAEKLAALGFTDNDLAERYRRFQRSRKLTAASGADPATVKAVKAEHLRLMQRQAAGGAQSLFSAGRSRYALGAAVFFLLLNVGLLGLFFAIRGTSRRLSELTQVLNDLDVKKPNVRH